jgi:hypothetical protein
MVYMTNTKIVWYSRYKLLLFWFISNSYEGRGAIDADIVYIHRACFFVNISFAVTVIFPIVLNAHSVIFSMRAIEGTKVFSDLSFPKWRVRKIHECALYSKLYSRLLMSTVRNMTPSEIVTLFPICEWIWQDFLSTLL